MVSISLLMKNYNIDLIARAIKIKPPPFSKQVEQILLSLFPLQNPVSDIKNEPIPIIRQARTMFVWVNLIVAPDTRASILVATPRLMRHFISRHFTGAFSVLNDSNINFKPRIRNIPKTIHFEKGRIYLYKVSVPIYPIIGMVPWKKPITTASFSEFSLLFSLKINPCEKDTTRQSIPNAIESKIISIKLNFHLKQSVPGVNVIYIYLINI